MLGTSLEGIQNVRGHHQQVEEVKLLLRWEII